MTPEQFRICQLCDELLEIIDSIDDLTRSDLQGIIQAWVMTNCKLS